ncbi:putative ATP-dependent RNA helicase DHX33 [Sarcoptes scabiei]|nr:putative ATP-dependent RNA helicase DHX33 [Sarcoptes scabiei]
MCRSDGFFFRFLLAIQSRKEKKRKFLILKFRSSVTKNDDETYMAFIIDFNHRRCLEIIESKKKKKIQFEFQSFRDRITNRLPSTNKLWMIGRFNSGKLPMCSR